MMSNRLETLENMSIISQETTHGSKGPHNADVHFDSGI